MIEQWINRLFGCAIDWGPGMLIGVMILIGLYKIAIKLGRDVGLKIVAALEKPAQALNSQAQSMDRMTGSIQEFVGRDRSEHREIIILLKVVSERVDRFQEDRGKELGKISYRLDEIAREVKDGRNKERAIPKDQRSDS